MTPFFSLPLIAQAQAQKHVTANEQALALEQVVPQVALGFAAGLPPAAPADGDAYILRAGASGFGAATEGDVAIWRGGQWVALHPPLGSRWWVRSENAPLMRGAAGWSAGSALGLHGANLGLRSIDTLVTVSGGSVALPIMPERAIIFGVSSWTVDAVTGASSYSVGDTGDAGKFGSYLGVAVGSHNIGVVGPYATYASGDLVISAQGGNFTGGVVGISIAALIPAVPV